ncbi:MAG TPA: hypothetical protein VEA69_21275 [Tepidisphaeraceae bacterium]|nr:hypothetical protein [Tepidisphaeraceae bacterium]
MRSILAVLLLAPCVLAAPALKADRAECKCGDGCACRDGRVDAGCTCPKGQCRCADVAIDNEDWCGVCPTDAHWFGCTFEQAEGNRLACDVYRRTIYRLRNDNAITQEAWAAMDFRCDCTTRMWTSLAAALDSGLTGPQRRAALRGLREHVGDADYYAGRIHAPIPPAFQGGR